MKPEEATKTIGEHPVRIYATDGGGPWPLHGAMFTEHEGWEAAQWTKKGRYFAGITHHHNDLDLTDWQEENIMNNINNINNSKETEITIEILREVRDENVADHYHWEVSPDRDGLGMVEIRERDLNTKNISARISFDPKVAKKVAECMIKCAEEMEAMRLD